MLEDKVDSPADRKSRTSSKVTVKYGILFLIVSRVFAYYGYLIGGWGWLLWWPALSFSTVACGYLGLGAKIFGKRTDGTIAWHVFPYLLRSRHLCIPAHRPKRQFCLEQNWARACFARPQGRSQGGLRSKYLVMRGRNPALCIVGEADTIPRQYTDTSNF